MENLQVLKKSNQIKDVEKKHLGMQFIIPISMEDEIKNDLSFLKICIRDTYKYIEQNKEDIKGNALELKESFSRLEKTLRKAISSDNKIAKCENDEDKIFCSTKHYLKLKERYLSFNLTVDRICKSLSESNEKNCYVEGALRIGFENLSKKINLILMNRNFGVIERKQNNCEILLGLRNVEFQLKEVLDFENNLDNSMSLFRSSLDALAGIRSKKIYDTIDDLEFALCAIRNNIEIDLQNMFNFLRSKVK